MRESDLTELDLDELSVVPKGANPGARIVLYKQEADMAEMTDAQKKRMAAMSDDMQKMMRANMDKGMSYDEAEKACRESMRKSDGDEAMIATLTSELDDVSKELDETQAALKAATDKLDAITKSAEAEGFVVDGTKITKAHVEYIEFGGERIAKGSVPDAVYKTLTAQAEELASIRKEREQQELIAKAGELIPNLSGSAEAKAKLLKAAGDDKDVLAILKAADTAASDLFKEVGTTAEPAPDSAAARLNKMAEGYAAEHSVTFHKAFAEITKQGEGRRLMDQSRREQMQ